MGTTREAILRGERENIDASEIEALKNSEPALLLAVLKDGTAEGLRLAVELGFDVNAQNSYTPLHHAAAADDVQTLQYLLEQGAGPSLTVKDDEYDATPLGWATFFGAKEAEALLADL